MADKIAVVKPAYEIESAYREGYDRFADSDADADAGAAVSHFKETAVWANTVAPDLRAAAGFDDTGPGTYTYHRGVAAVEPGCEDDEPAEATLVEARDVYRKLVEAFESGARDALADCDPDPDAVEW